MFLLSVDRTYQYGSSSARFSSYHKTEFPRSTPAGAINPAYIGVLLDSGPVSHVGRQTSRSRGCSAPGRCQSSRCRWSDFSDTNYGGDDDHHDNHKFSTFTSKPSEASARHGPHAIPSSGILDSHLDQKALLRSRG